MLRKLVDGPRKRLVAAVVGIAAASTGAAVLAPQFASGVATTTNVGTQTTSTRACQSDGTCKTIQAGNCPTSFSLVGATNEPRDKNRDGFICTRFNSNTNQNQITDNYVH